MTTTTTGGEVRVSSSIDSPLSRLIADLEPRIRSENFASQGAFHDTGKPRELLRELRNRLDAADELYPGIRSAIDRGVVDALDAALLESGSAVLYERGRADRAQEIAADRLEGARELHAQTQTANSRLRRLAGADLQNVALTATVWELEATLKRISRNGNRLIAAARARASVTAELESSF